MSQPLYFSLTLVSVPGHRRDALALVSEIERRGFEGIFCAQSGASMALCHSLAHTTTTLRFGTGIVNIYGRNPVELAQAASYLNEVSGGRFTLGLGVSHQPFNDALGVTPGRPVPDMRNYVERLRGAGPEHGGLPPVYLAALRPRMMALAANVAEGVLIANMPLSRAKEVTGSISEPRRTAGFWVGNIVPICVSDDRKAALAALHKREMVYVTLPYYMNFWRENGYQDEVDRMARAYQDGGPEAAAAAMDERWLADVTIFGNRRQVRERLEEWQVAGVSPVLGPVSTTGDPFDGFRDVMDALA